MAMLQLAAASSDVEKARAVARALGGTVFVDERPDAHDLPFRALVTAVTDDASALLEAADVGAWVVCRRVMKPRVGVTATAARPLLGVIGLYPMVRNPAM